MTRILTSIFLLFCFQLFAEQQRAVQNLAGINFEKGETVQLNGAWEFYWNQLLYPDDFQPSKKPVPDLWVKPSSWNDLVIDGKKCGSYGCATYRLTLINVPSHGLMMNAYSMQTSSRIFLNGELVSEIGTPAFSKEKTQPMTRDAQVLIPGKDSVEIILQVSNFHHRKGGFVSPFEIGSVEVIQGNQTFFFILDSIESAALGVIGFFLLALYIFRRKDLSILYFSLFSITLSFRPVISVNYLLGTLIPDFNWSLMLKLEYLGVMFPCLFMVLFIRQLFPNQLNIWLVRIFTGIFALKILITLFCPPAVFSWLVLPLLILIPIGVLVMTITIIRALIARVDGANYAGMGVVVLFVSLVLKVMTYAGILSPMHLLITMLDIGFIFMMSLILGSRFSIQFVKVETLQAETEKQRAEIAHQKVLVDEKNKEILDSINYAKRIQAAILPPAKAITQFFPDHFILYKPKDIVAGDFYWLESKNNHVMLAAADCTGHGVPGSLVSVICNNGLNRSVREHGLTDAGKILDRTREIILSEFEKSEDDVKDGMDISVLSFPQNFSQHQTVSVTWSGANNPLWILRNNSKQLEEIKGDAQPIGKFADAKPFQSHHLELNRGDIVYLFTDGYADQFGGEKNKKFKYSRLKDLLISLSPHPMKDQQKLLEKMLLDWKRDLEQTDDICIIGVRI